MSKTFSRINILEHCVTDTADQITRSKIILILIKKKRRIYRVKLRAEENREEKYFLHSFFRRQSTPLDITVD